ncbi:MAG: hypothetical protein ACPIOQ_79245 [Promethearchaeia archaeon]
MTLGVDAPQTDAPAARSVDAAGATKPPPAQARTVSVDHATAAAGHTTGSDAAEVGDLAAGLSPGSLSATDDSEESPGWDRRRRQRPPRPEPVSTGQESPARSPSSAPSINHSVRTAYTGQVSDFRTLSL